MADSVWRGSLLVQVHNPTIPVPVLQNRRMGARSCKVNQDRTPTEQEHTFKRREATVENQLKIAKLTLGEEQGRESLGLSLKLSMARGIASDQVLEDAAVGRVGHLEYVKTVVRYTGSGSSKVRDFGARR